MTDAYDKKRIDRLEELLVLYFRYKAIGSMQGKLQYLIDELEVELRSR